MPKQLDLTFSAVRNSELFSNHWLEHRLRDQPEYTALRTAASEALAKLSAL